MKNMIANCYQRHCFFLLDLWDTSANNTIHRGIQRAVPIIVKDHPAVREYLGNDYLLYFQDLNQIYD